MLKENALVRVKYTESDDRDFEITRGDIFVYTGLTLTISDGYCALCKPVKTKFHGEDYFFYTDQLEEVKL